MPSIRHTMRTLKAAPGPTAVILLSLAVAIAATTIIASTIDGVWRAIPATDTERLVFVASTDPRPSEAQSGMSGNLAMTGTSVPDLFDWSARATTIEQFAAFRYDTATMTGRTTPVRVSLVRATANLFAVWGIEPALGRVLNEEDGRLGATPVALLGHRYWQEQFAADVAVVGTSVLLEGVVYLIVGVLPQDTGRGIFADTGIFVAQPLDPARTRRDERRLFVTARLKPSVTRAQAQADLAVIAARLASEHPDTNAQTGVVVRPLIEQVGGEVPTLLVLLGLIAVLVVVMACANVSNVVLAQASSRQRELSVRTALGATRLHHLQRVVMESLFLSTIAGAAGLLLGGWGLAILKWLSGPQARLFGDATLNVRVAAAAIATSFVLPLGFAMIPGIRSFRPNPADLKDGARSVGSGRGHRVRRTLVAVQVGLAIVLLVQIALFARTAWSFGTTETGFHAEGVLTFRVDLPRSRYDDPPRATEFYQSLLQRIDALPGIVGSGAINRLPIAEREASARVRTEDAAAVAVDALPLTALSTVTRGYFDALRVPIRRGRAFTESDFDGDVPAAAVVSAEAARRFWGARDPIGRRLTLVAGDAPQTPLLVVGIAADARNAAVDQRAGPQIYVPFTWKPERTMAVVVRSTFAHPAAALPAIRAQAAVLEPNGPIFDVATMEQVLFNDLASLYSLAGLLGVIAVVTLCLAAVGVYGVACFSVTQRTREIGVRMALGARPGAMLRMVLQHSSAPVAAGGLLGLCGAGALVSATSGVFSSIDVQDPTNYAGVLLVTTLVALAACFIPARRASRLDPLTTLRQD